MSKTKKICALTMARNDDFFLTRWIEYYAKHLGEQHLYVFLDGEDQPVPRNAGKVNVKHEKRVVEHVVRAEKRRLGFLSERSEEHTSELQSLMRTSYAVFCLKKKKTHSRK